MDIDLTRPDELTDEELDAIIANPARYGLFLDLFPTPSGPLPDRVRATLRETVREALREAREAGHPATGDDPGGTQDS